MTDDQTTHHAEAILRAAGSSLRHYEARTREAILAAVREAVGEWLPIERAPKDGTHILLVWSYNNGTPPRVSEAFWRNDMPFSNDGVWWCFHGRMFQEPTHWQHLPTPPRGE